MRYAALLFFLLACQSQTQQEAAAPPMSPEEQRQHTQDSLFDAMMAIHDEVMPEMDHIYQLRQQIRAELDSLNALANPEKARLDALEQAYLNLAEADEAMMNWMRSNDFTFDSLTYEETIVLIEQEKEAIQEVADQMHASIDEAEALLPE